MGKRHDMCSNKIPYTKKQVCQTSILKMALTRGKRKLGERHGLIVVLKGRADPDRIIRKINKKFFQFDEDHREVVQYLVEVTDTRRE